MAGIKANTIILYSALIEALSSNENKECIEDIAHYFNSKKREKQIIDNKPFLRRGSCWLDEMAEIGKDILGIEIDEIRLYLRTSTLYSGILQNIMQTERKSRCIT